VKKNPKKKRSSVKYPGLDPSVNIRIRWELISDYDYLDKLGDKEKEWLNKFTKEYVNAEIDNKQKRKNLHKTKALIRDCYNRNNARNRCVLSKAKASGRLPLFGTDPTRFLGEVGAPSPEVKAGEYEDFLITMIDKKRV
jgi:hypothetical protein